MPGMQDLADHNALVAQHKPTKPIHDAPVERNVPSDMVSTPPVACDFKVGDAVVFTNDYGVKFDLTVRGFAKEVHGSGRFVYVFTDAWWFPVKPASLTFSAAKATGGAQ